MGGYYGEKDNSVLFVPQGTDNVFCSFHNAVVCEVTLRDTSRFNRQAQMTIESKKYFVHGQHSNLLAGVKQGSFTESTIGIDSSLFDLASRFTRYSFV